MDVDCTEIQIDLTKIEQTDSNRVVDVELKRTILDEAEIKVNRQQQK